MTRKTNYKITQLDAEAVLSSPLDPRCVRLDMRQVKALLAILEPLRWHTRWFNADNYSQEELDEFTDSIYAELTDVHTCFDELEEYCYDVPPWSPQIEWFPESPYDPQNGPLQPPAWFVVGKTISGWVSDLLTTITNILGLEDAISQLTGYEYGDVITTLLQIDSAFGAPITTGNFGTIPGFKFSFDGPATVELHLLEVLAGGTVFVGLDQDPFANDGITLEDIISIIDTFVDPNDQVMDLERRIGSFPTVYESGDAERIIELTAETPGPHYISVRFLPGLEADITPIAFGGGLRKITICGEAGGTPEMYDLRVNAECVLEYSINGGVTWNPVQGAENMATCWQGPAGIQGPAGPAGPAGPTGDPGTPGDPTGNLPPTPEPGTEAMCNAAWNVANEIQDIIDQVIIDHVTNDPSTLAYQLYLTLTGFFLPAALLEMVERIYEAVSDANLGTRINTLKPTVAEALYCYRLDISDVIADINANAAITDTEARYIWTTALQSADAGAVALWAWSAPPGADCSGFDCPPEIFQVEWDFVDEQDLYTPDWTSGGAAITGSGATIQVSPYHPDGTVQGLQPLNPGIDPNYLVAQLKWTGTFQLTRMHVIAEVTSTREQLGSPEGWVYIYANGAQRAADTMNGIGNSIIDAEWIPASPFNVTSLGTLIGTSTTGGNGLVKVRKVIIEGIYPSPFTKEIEVI